MSNVTVISSKRESVSQHCWTMIGGECRGLLERESDEKDETRSHPQDQVVPAIDQSKTFCSQPLAGLTITALRNEREISSMRVHGLRSILGQRGGLGPNL